MEDLSSTNVCLLTDYRYETAVLCLVKCLPDRQPGRGRHQRKVRHTGSWGSYYWMGGIAAPSLGMLRTIFRAFHLARDARKLTGNRAND